MQLTFGDAEGLGKRKQTHREIFLAEMEQVVPWQQLLGLIAPHYPVSGRPGRQPYALATMLRIHLLQQWYALSDPAMEEALHEIPTLRRFAQLGGLDNMVYKAEPKSAESEDEASERAATPVEQEAPAPEAAELPMARPCAKHRQCH
ncbi:hypothetical protein AO073_14775 [Pseudomonas syringae ICMP 11293]|nr:hypothetical protein AO073_14775 [Pseudomonas syringae ICMP 11293]